MLLAAFFICVLMQCLYGLFFLRNTARPSALYHEKPTIPVTVLICARNEAQNLSWNLPAVLEQKYTDEAGTPLYEVLVVDDQSTDDTQDVVTDLMAQFSHLRYIKSGHPAGKQYALQTGAEAAQYDVLVLTDADCTPAGSNWLAALSAPFSEGKEIVLGYGRYNSRPGLLNTFIRWETVHTFLQYSSYAIAGIPYMGVGRNMACTRHVLQSAGNHPLWQKLTSGHDDIIVQSGAGPGNTAVVCTPEAVTCSDAEKSWDGWVKQKQRHTSTGKYYREPGRTLLGIYAITHAGMWLSILVMSILCLWTPAALVLFAVRCVIAWLVFRLISRKTGERFTFFIWLAGDSGWMIYNFAFLPYISWKNKTNWK